MQQSQTGGCDSAERTHLEEFPVEKERRGDSEGEQPKNDDSARGPALDEVRLHGEHDAEEPVAGDEGQGHDAGYKGQYCNQKDRKMLKRVCFCLSRFEIAMLTSIIASKISRSC